MYAKLFLYGVIKFQSVSWIACHVEVCPHKDSIFPTANLQFESALNYPQQKRKDCYTFLLTFFKVLSKINENDYSFIQTLSDE